jgi:hypothetical protein
MKQDAEDSQVELSCNRGCAGQRIQEAYCPHTTRAEDMKKQQEEARKLQEDALKTKADLAALAQKHEEEMAKMRAHQTETDKKMDRLDVLCQEVKNEVGEWAALGETPESQRMQSIVTGFWPNTVARDMETKVQECLNRANVNADTVKSVAPVRDPGSACHVLFDSAHSRIVAELAWKSLKPMLPNGQGKARNLLLRVTRTEKEMRPIYKINHAAKLLREVEENHRLHPDTDQWQWIKQKRDQKAIVLAADQWTLDGSKILGYYHGDQWTWQRAANDRYDPEVLKRVGNCLSCHEA